MNNSDETLERSTLENEDSAVLKAIAELNKTLYARIDTLEANTNNQFEAITKKLDTYDTQFEAITKKLDIYDTQFEAIRIRIVANSAAFDRLEAKVLLLRADVKDLTE